MPSETGKELVREFASETEAYLACSLLEQHGIAATVHRYSRYRAMAGGGYHLKVPKGQGRQAKALLGTPGDIDMDEYADADDTRYRRCPECASVNVDSAALPPKQWLLNVLLLGRLPRGRHCRKCGHDWRA